MRIALISDVHGNLEALQNVLRDIEKQGAEKIHFLGDAVGYGCNPNECVRLINKHCDIKLLGNHDYAAMGLESTEHFNRLAQASMNWTQTKIKDKTIRVLADFEMEAVFLDYLLVHSSPSEPDKWHYILNLEQAGHHFENFSQSVCFIGHSHGPVCFELSADGIIRQYSKSIISCEKDKRYIINIGSVGQPRDNDPRGCYAMVDTDTGTVAYRRVEYDVEKTQEKMRKARFPDFLVERLSAGV